MGTRRIVLRRKQRAKLLRKSRACKDAKQRLRYLMVLHAAEGKSLNAIAKALKCSMATVGKWLDRFFLYGEAGLIDQREDNGDTKADANYQDWVAWILRSTPQDYGHRRPTWTLGLLILTAKQFTRVTVSQSTMSRLLARIKARRGRPKPLARCPLSKPAKDAVIDAIKKKIDTLPASHAAVWVDEADLDLNPKIGFDWMLPGTQRTVMTPGKNVKYHLAGALDAQTDLLTWIKGPSKASVLFIDLLKKLDLVYAGKKVVHVILDNYVIHSSRQTRLWLEEHGKRFKLHFLPPYCPDDNRIERKVWREMHANVTINHRCPTIERLIEEAVDWMTRYNRTQRMKAA